MALSEPTITGSEPVSLGELKAHLRFENTAEDDLIADLGKAARQYAETVTGLQLIAATYTWKLDSFGQREGQSWQRWGERFGYGGKEDFLVVPRPPLVSVQSITYADSLNADQTFDASYYAADTTSRPGRIYLVPYNIWPVTFARANAISIAFTAGYATAAAVPSSIKTAIKMLASHWFETRRAVSDKPYSTVPMAVESLLRAESTGQYY